MRPLVGGSTPATILISVDFPAPLSPTRATISPGVQVQIEFFDRDDASKRFVNILQGQNWRARWRLFDCAHDMPHIGQSAGRPKAS
jgi:hypothetical protein